MNCFVHRCWGIFNRGRPRIAESHWEATQA